MRTKILLVIAMCLSIGILLGLNIDKTYMNGETDQSDKLIITEVVSNNLCIIYDQFGNTSDYIEIYNNSDDWISLEGYGLSDEGSLPLKWTFPDVKIGPSAYMVVFASKEDVRDTNEKLHTNFTIDKHGERVILSTPEGEIISQVLVPESNSNMAYGVLADDLFSYVFYISGTPGKANDEMVVEDVSAYMKGLEVQYSNESGFYTEAFELELSVDNKDAVIYYTTDGADPTPNAFMYQEPIEITNLEQEEPYYSMLKNFTFDSNFTEAKNLNSDSVYMCNVIKAQAFINGVPYGDIMDKTYFVDDAGGDLYTFPVVSMTVDPEIFFGDDIGIYNTGAYYEVIAPFYADGETPANYNQRGIEWERPASITYFNEIGEYAFEYDLGVRTFGGWSRMYPKKSLKLFIRDSYDQRGELQYPLFEGLTDASLEPIEAFSRLVLRNGGNDWDATVFRDVMMTDLVSDLVDVQAYQPVILFINGEYWGIYNLREIVNDDYIVSHYGVEKEDLTMIVVKNEVALYEGDEEDLQDYIDFINYVDDNDLSDPEQYEIVANQLDIENVLNYYISQLYYQNTDWPGNNCKVWRKDIEGIDNEAEIGHDGKWRFVLYDTDFGFGLYDWTKSINTLENATTPFGEEWPNPYHSTVLLRNLLENDDFKNQFIRRYTDLLNSRFSYDYLVEVIDSYKSIYGPEMEENIGRWVNTAWGSYDMWEKEFVPKLESFARTRASDVHGELMGYFDLDAPVDITVNIQGSGSIEINDFLILENEMLPYNGEYYGGIEISLTAIEQEGAQFLGWSGDIESNATTITVSPEEGMTITAEFQ